MSRNIFLLLLVLALPIGLSAAPDNLPFGGRQAGMGNTGVTLYDFWAISHNQAGIAQLQHAKAGFYFENRYLIKEMSFGAAAFVLPTSSGTFGLSLSYYGFSLFNQSKASLCYARPFGEFLSAGVQLNYHYTSIGEGYGSSGNVTAEVGLIYELIPGLNIGAHIFNPTQARIAAYQDERIATIMRIGLSYIFSEKLLLSIETEKDINREAIFRTGIEYSIAQGINLRAGIGTQPTTNAFGLGLLIGNMEIDIASSFHYVLGYSPQISILYNFK